MERHQLHFIEPFSVVGDGGQRRVGIGIRVAMTGEVLCRSQYPLILQPQGIGRSQAGDPQGIFAEGPVADYGIVGIRIDIHVRGEVDMHPDGLEVPGDASPHLPNQHAVIGSTQCERPRKPVGGIQPHRKPPFTVKSHQQRNGGCRLKPLHQRTLRRRSTLHADDSADAQFPAPFQGQIPIPPLLFGIHRWHHQLGDHFRQCQGFHDGIGPSGGPIAFRGSRKKRGLHRGPARQGNGGVRCGLLRWFELAFPLQPSRPGGPGKKRQPNPHQNQTEFILFMHVPPMPCGRVMR